MLASLDPVLQDLKAKGRPYKTLLCPDSWPSADQDQHLVCGVQQVFFSNSSPTKSRIFYLILLPETSVNNIDLLTVEDL